MSANQAGSPFDPHDLAVEGYLYLYPLVTMEVSRRQMTNVGLGEAPGRAPMNVFAHLRSFPEADFRMVVRPNFDTLYSSVWLDLSDGPVVVSAPDTGGRYYLLPMLDMWTNVFASPGWRTSGTDAGSWAVVPPGWTGDLPPGVRAIQAPTPYVWVIGRTQTNGPSDYDAVHVVQDGFTVTALARWGLPPQPPRVVIDRNVDMATEPMRQVNALSAAEFFDLGARLMGRHAPAVTDWSIVERIARIGVVPGEPFDAAALDPGVLSALETVPADALERMKAFAPQMAKTVSGWSLNTDTMGVYGNSYLKRAVVALMGLGANQPEDAFYPLQFADNTGQPSIGAYRYTITFAPDAVPPVDAFWSITMYDEEGFQIENRIDRYAIGDRDALTYSPDGSLTILIQAEDPGAEQEGNWLPASKGPFSLTMRLYAPHAAALDGRWSPPPLTRA